MKKLKKILLSNGLLCTLLTLMVLAGMHTEFYPLQFFEYKAYDILTALKQRKDNSPVVVVAIDDEAVKNIGSWPWPRSYIADMIRRLSEYGAHTIGICLLYPDREINTGVQEIHQLREILRNDPDLEKLKGMSKIDGILVEAGKKLDCDADLISAVRSAVNLILPIDFTFGPSEESPDSELSAWMKMNSWDPEIKASDSRNKFFSFENSLCKMKNQGTAVVELTPTYDELAGKAAALGHMNFIADRDGVVRKVPLLISYKGRSFFSFALQTSAKYVGGSVKDLKPINGGLRIKGLEIPTDRNFRMLIDYSPKRNCFESYSFSEVRNGKVSADAFRKKMVLVGVTAPRWAPAYQTPVQSNSPGVELIANVAENILNGKHCLRPGWAFSLEALFTLYLYLFLVFVIPRVNLRIGVLILGIFLATWVGVVLFFYMIHGHWLKVSTPIIFSTAGFILAAYKKVSGKKHYERVELNKMLGLSFQERGVLDMAFEKFMKCPVEDESIKGLFYNLGLDFERKRMFSKALSTYEHILKAGKFKDIKERIKTLKNIAKISVLDANSSEPDATLLLEEGTTKPTLGRYEILKEIGQGAMGTVYLGIDHKINRKVAIKTMKYGKVDIEQLEEVKKRFFLEAEAAGKLSHPKIVTIFDVGEDYDMAYIAMEFINGSTLEACCHKESLLPTKRVLKIVSSIAEALAYAHSQGVVHRDLKPANIMLLENDQVKVTDFGIARVMASSDTQTGIILGTPNYMSPEQMAGKKVDGRSDLFSLGIVFYELLTGEKPFKGESMAALIYAISNASYTPLAETAPKVPACCAEIVDKLLAKSLTRRFNSANKVVEQIQLCLDQLK